MRPIPKPQNLYYCRDKNSNTYLNWSGTEFTDQTNFPLWYGTKEQLIKLRKSAPETFERRNLILAALDPNAE